MFRVNGGFVFIRFECRIVPQLRMQGKWEWKIGGNSANIHSSRFAVRALDASRQAASHSAPSEGLMQKDEGEIAKNA